MKRFISLALSSLLFLSVAAQTVTIQITGLVTDITNNTPVANQPVNIMSDSMMGGTFFYYNQVFTDNQGMYNDYVTVPSNLQIPFYISTVDCNGNYLMQTGMSTNPPIIANFNICTGTSTLCDAYFFAVPDSSNPAGNLTINFWDYSTGNPIAWYWSFGDSTTSTQQNPQHTYAQPGTYTVCLTIATAGGTTCSYCSTVVVGYNNPCQANFVYVPDSNNTNGFYFFDLSSGSPTNWSWSFGDGTGSNLQNPQHVYNGQGTYQVCLSIYGNNCQDSYCDVITIGSGNNCQAMFYVYPDSNMSNNTYQFVDMSVSTPNPPTSWSWYFGDGTTSTLQNPVHTYAQPGYYGVCLTIGNNSGCQSTNCDTLLVGPPAPCANYFYFTLTGLTSSFYGYGYNGTPPYTFMWDFGDGTTSALQNPVHTYAVSGTYTVTLTTADSQGCTVTSTQNVTVTNGNSGTIWGQVYGGGALLDFGWVYLYMANNVLTTMTLIDSTYIDSLGMYWFYMMNPLPGVYYVKAAPAPNSAFFNTFVPTYYTSTPFWNNATPIYIQQPNNPNNINLVGLNQPPMGPGNIGGQVTNGNKLFQTGDPAPGVEVLLLNTSDVALSVDYTDNQGYFSFSNLALGTYKVWTEVTGLPTTPAIVTLTTNNPNSSLPIIITPSGIILDVPEELVTEVSLERIYPNPAFHTTNLELNLTHSSTLEISIYNLLGEKMQTLVKETNAGSHKLSIDVSDLAPGTYTLQISTNTGFRKVEKLTVIR